MKMITTVARLLLVVAVAGWSIQAECQTWTPINNPPPCSVGYKALLTDGTVLAHCEFTSDDTRWFKLTPDITGSYINGTWTQAASLPSNYAPVDFGGGVLPSGKLVVEGGEWNFGQDVETNQGAIYDPVANQWTAINPPSGWTLIGDAPSVVLPNGTLMVGQSGSATKAQALLNESTLTWTLTGSNKFDANAEEGWVLLPDGKVLTVDAFFGQFDPTGTSSETYDPSTGSWTPAGSTVVQLWDSAANCGGSSSASFEVGPMVLRPDGTVFAMGSNSCAGGHTAIFNSVTGTWTAGPDFPGTLDIADGPAALEINGNVLMMTSPGVFQNGAVFFEWNGSTLTEIPGPSTAVNDPSFAGKFLELPTGQILFSDYSTNLQVFTPAGTFDSAWQPSINFVPSSLTPGSTVTINGTQFNGFSQGAMYGDDAQTASNWPLVRIVNSATGHVFYCRTHNHSTMAVATGTQPVSTQFDVPANIETGPGQLVVVTNGIPSEAVSVTVGATTSPSASLNPSSLSFGSVVVGIASAAQTVTLKNNGPGSLNISRIAASGDFAESSNCGASLASGSSCSITVTFTPTAAGARTGTLTVTDSASNNPQTATLTGTGVAQANTASLSTASLTFGSQNVGTSSAPQSVTLKNSGSSAMAISSIAATGDFAQSNNCSTPLASGASCTISVSFKPTASGNRTGTLTVTDNASNSPQTASLVGTGTVASGGGNINFSGTIASQGGFTRTATFTSGAGVLTATLNVPAGTAWRFVLENDTINQAVAEQDGTGPLTITFNATAGSYDFFVQATTGSGAWSITGALPGGTGSPAAALNPATLAFGSQNVGTASAAQIVTLSNTGTASLSIASIAASGDFAQTSNCGSSLASGASCTISVTFRPTASGTRTGSLTVTDNASGSPQTVSLTGTGAGGGGNINFSGNIASQGSFVFTSNFSSNSGTVTATLNVPAGTSWRYVLNNVTANQVAAEQDGTGPLTITFNATAATYNFFVEAITGSGSWTISGSHP